MRSLADNTLLRNTIFECSDTNMVTFDPRSHSDSDTTVPMVPLCTRGHVGLYSPDPCGHLWQPATQRACGNTHITLIGGLQSPCKRASLWELDRWGGGVACRERHPPLPVTLLSAEAGALTWILAPRLFSAGRGCSGPVPGLLRRHEQGRSRGTPTGSHESGGGGCRLG